MSLRINVVEKPKSKLPASILSARFAICHEADEPCSMTCTTFITSSPAVSAKSSPSANAWQSPITQIWFVILVS